MTELSKEELVGKVASLTATIEGVRRSMFLAASLPAGWRLTPMERDLFLALISNDTVTKPMAMVILYGADQEGRPTHSVDVFISRIRRKTENHSVTIETINRTGYRLVDRLVWAKTLKLDISVAH
ncbi:MULTISPECIES: helix-turn-helix domain-containing protein [unclassified Bradyrhizobium]|uniref:helix-turn-helix domain-containing protein n=1 Tax=unclassified Bradyrhizobium TaxID=2631580 RepID=UPI0028E74015|nr:MULTISPECIES: helix-turn-helix domain-containing protein [unclassified Bradyrhizobium]